MNKIQATKLITKTFNAKFDENNFTLFIKNLLNDIEQGKKVKSYSGNYIWDDYKDHIKYYKRIGKYTDPEGESLDVLIVEVKTIAKLERARTSLRNFVTKHLKNFDKNFALVAFYVRNENRDIEKDWRFSFIKLEHQSYFEEEKDKVKIKEDLTPAKRYSFLVGENEQSHTAKTQLLPLLQNLANNPTIGAIENAFSIEKVTDEFFNQYKNLYVKLFEHFENDTIKIELSKAKINNARFTKKLLGQIVFLYFLQKKGWLGVPKDEKWGKGEKRFIQNLFDKSEKENYFKDYLQPLFYEALAKERNNELSFYKKFKCRIPFLNGGLFEAEYDWKTANITIPQDLFRSNETNEDERTGILDVFDRYNFTIKEDEPLDKEVAVDPEMLGKVFENMLEITERKSKGAFYTPREIVHHMCQESLIHYLHNALEGKVEKQDIEIYIRKGHNALENDQRVAKKGETKTYKYILPQSIRQNADDIDQKLIHIKICDPAIGSGAFPVGLLHELVNAQLVLKPHFSHTYLREKEEEFGFPFHESIHESRYIYRLKRHIIQESIYGVDIDAAAIDIAQLRLWLSLVIDEDDIDPIETLPNLDYKIVQGNSLIGMPENAMRNTEVEDEIEKLKELFYNESNENKKKELRTKINLKIRKLLDSAEEFADYKIAFDFKLYFSEVWHKNKGFDIIIGNPPYVGEKGNKEIFRPISQANFKQFYERRMDLFYFFFHLALDLGKENAQCAFITTNYYLTALGAKKLRADLKNRAVIKKLINFNELRIFESALGQHNLITIFSKQQNKECVAKTAITKRKGNANRTILNAIFSKEDKETEYFEINQKDVFDGDENYIRMAGNRPIDAILNKMQKQGKCLGGKTGICNVNQGIVTGADKVSNSHKTKYGIDAKTGDGIFVLTDDECNKIISDNEKHLLKKWFKNSDIKKWFCNENTKNNLVHITSKKSITTSSLLKHFEKFKLLLINRNVRTGRVNLCDYEEYVKGLRDIPYVMIKSTFKKGVYYAISYAREDLDFESPKIVAPQRSRTNTFGYNEISWYASADVYFITAKDNSPVELKYVLALLNSKLYFHWLYNRGKRKGEMLELYQKPLSEIPIKVISKAAQKPFINLVERILSKKANGESTEAEEREIDRLVYGVYGLSAAEIGIIEKK